MREIWTYKVNLAVSGNKVRGPIIKVGSYYSTEGIPLPFSEGHLKQIVESFKGLPIAFPDVNMVSKEDTHYVKDYIGTINNAWIDGEWIWGEGNITKSEYLKYVKEQQGVSVQLWAFEDEQKAISYVPTHVMVIPPCVDDKFCTHPQVKDAKLHLVNNALGETMNREQELLATMEALRKENKALKLNLAGTAEPFIKEIVNGEAYVAVSNGEEYDHFKRTAELLDLADAGKLEELIKMRDEIRASIDAIKVPQPNQVNVDKAKTPVTTAPKINATPGKEDKEKELSQLPFRERMKKATEMNGGEIGKTLGFGLGGN